MGRPLRNVLTGETVHIMIRTAHFESVFNNDYRKSIAIDIYRRAQEKFNFELNSIVVMDNHIHAIIKIIDDNHSISKIMHWINMMIAKSMNKVIERNGPFWNERFKSVHVYNFPQVNLYLAYNPVKKRLSSLPGNYYPSSYLSYYNLEYEFPLKITIHSEFLELGKTFSEAVKNYEKLEEEYLIIHPELMLFHNEILFSQGA